MGKKFPIDSRGVRLVVIVSRLYTQIPKNFSKPERGSGSAKHPRGTYCVVYPLCYITGTLCMCKGMSLLWVAVGQVMALRRVRGWLAEIQNPAKFYLNGVSPF